MAEGLRHQATKATRVIDGGAPQLPRIGGITTWSRRQARRSISSQARNCRSLLMQIRTSLSRVLLQVTDMAELLRPGLTLMKASSISAGATVFGSDRSRYSGGVLTAERAWRMVSKKARGSSPEQVPCLSHSLKISPGAGIRSSIDDTILRSSRGDGRWQYSGKPCSYCGHRPWTTKENGRPPHWTCERPWLPRSDASSQKEGDHDSDST